jgi:integrase
MRYSAKIIHRSDAIKLDGTAALGLQVIIDRKRKVFPLHIWVRKEEFFESGPSIKLSKSGKDWRELQENYNALMLNALSRALLILSAAEVSHKPIDLDTFSGRFSSVGYQKDFLAFMIQAIEQERGLVSDGTTDDNMKVYKRLLNFKKTILFSDINLGLVKEFEKAMLKWGYGPNTIASTHKGFRKFINLAKEEVPHLVSPYKEYSIKWADGDREFLDPHELRIVLDAYNSGELSGAMLRACRCFLFQCFTGLRVGDAKELTYDNLVAGHLVFIAEKTQRVKLRRKLKLNSIAKKLIEDAHAEWGSKRQEGSLMHFYDDDQVYNKALQNMATYLGIEKWVTSHVGRHTFATNYLLAGGKVERLMRLLGHSKLETTMVYVHLVEEYLDKDMEGLADYFMEYAKAA